eukprot:TRINITY_DN11643_c0_g1_i2.p1 TRINITY_DN11643_c0_g1~~TRINITY_DN11643_c0_g1_i2.p1  ORF type:complete len:231 (+),score=22.34 TRINITY_DN11643_c0_g1_i2:86-778(+)
MAVSTIDNCPVGVIKCAPSSFYQQILNRYPSLNQMNSYNTEARRLNQWHNEAASAKSCMSDYIKKLNACMRESEDPQLYSSVCFPSTTRETLLERIPQDKGLVDAAKRPIIRFKEGRFKSLKIVKAVFEAVAKPESQLVLKPSNRSNMEPKKSSAMYARNTTASDLLLDNYSKHNLKEPEYNNKQKQLSIFYFAKTARGKQNKAPTIKLAKVHSKRNYGIVMKEWKTCEV